MVVESAVGVVSVSAVVRSAAAVSAAAVAIAASVVIVNGAAHRAAAASGAVIASAAAIASGAAAAAAIDQCVLVATNSSTYGAALATWIDLWACTGTRAICHARAWTAIRWTGTAIARADDRACWNTSVGVQNAADSAQLASMAALELICAWEKTRPASPGPRRGRKCTGEIQPHVVGAKLLRLLSDTRAQNRARTHVPLLAQLLRNARERSPLAGVTVVHPEKRILESLLLRRPGTTRRAHIG